MITTQLIHIGFQLSDLVWISAEEGIVIHAIPTFERYLDGAQLTHITAYLNTLRCQVLFGNRTCGNAHSGFPRGRASAAAVITHAVFVVIGVICMRRSEQVLDGRVVLGFLIGITDQQTNRAAGGHTFKHAGQNLHLIRFLALGGMPASTRLAAIQVALQILARQR